jgi:EmrB/QacA subfamily drug resistance transporter
MIGRDRVWTVGASTFALASIGCGLAPNLEVLIACRLIQGAGAAAMKPTTVAMVAGMFPEERRGWALGVMGSALAGAAAFGPVIGGVLTASLGWRAIFVVNAPIALAAILILRRSGRSEQPGAPRERIDVTGAAVLGAALLLVILALNEGDAFGGALTAGVVGTAVLCGVAFAIMELRRETPILELHLFRRPAFLAGNAITLLTSIGFFGAFFLQSLYLQGVADFSILESGLLLAPLGTATLLSSTVGGRLSDRIGARPPIVVGLGLCAAGLALLGQTESESSYWGHIFPAYVLEGAGWGLASAPLNSAVIGAAGVDRAGQAAGVMSTFDKFGSAFGVALASSLFDSRAEDAVPAELAAHGVRADPSRLEQLVATLGTNDIHQQVERIVPGDTAAALRALDDAAVQGFDLVMAVSAGAFALALVLAAIGLRGATSRRAHRHWVPRRSREAHRQVPGRLEG